MSGYPRIALTFGPWRARMRTSLPSRHQGLCASSFPPGTLPAILFHAWRAFKPRLCEMEMQPLDEHRDAPRDAEPLCALLASLPCGSGGHTGEYQGLA
jgi:hypothetical protein